MVSFTHRPLYPLGRAPCSYWPGRSLTENPDVTTAIDSYNKRAITCSSAICTYVPSLKRKKNFLRRTNIFWNMTPCSLLDMYQSIGEACWPISRRNSKSCTLKVKAAFPAETSVRTHQITWRLTVRAHQITWRLILRTHQVTWRLTPIKSRGVTYAPIKSRGVPLCLGPSERVSCQRKLYWPYRNYTQANDKWLQHSEPEDRKGFTDICMNCSVQ